MKLSQKNFGKKHKMKISKSQLIDGVLVGPKQTLKMGERMGAESGPSGSESDPYSAVQKTAEEQAQAAQTGADDGLGSTNTNDANNLAAALLRKHNRHEFQCELNLLGDTSLCAGIVINLDSSFGAYSGDYLVTKCVHRVARAGSGYSTQVSAHKCLEDY